MPNEPKAGWQRCPAGLSFAPVGLDVVRLDAEDDEHSIDVSLAEAPVHGRKRKAGRVAAAAGAAGIVVLLLAAFGRAGHRRLEPPAMASPTSPPDRSEKDANRPDPAGVAPPEASVAAAPAMPTTGTLRLRWPASPNHVWLDGAKLGAVSSVVSCGTHQIKLGARSRPRAIEVPCGKQIEITR